MAVRQVAAENDLVSVRLLCRADRCVPNRTDTSRSIKEGLSGRLASLEPSNLDQPEPEAKRAVEARASTLRALGKSARYQGSLYDGDADHMLAIPHSFGLVGSEMCEAELLQRVTGVECDNPPGQRVREAAV